MLVTNRDLFFEHVAQTSFSPLAIEVESAKGMYLYGPNGQKYMDTVSGVSVANIGHCNPMVVDAIKEQSEKYLHLMVYGEMIQPPQVKLAQKLCSLLPENLNNVFLVNSGSEATDGALKLAKRHTSRPWVVSFKNAYHGSSIGAMSLWGSEYFKSAYRPLMPCVKTLNFNSFEDLEQIDDQVACVITEPIQSEGGLVLPQNNWLMALRKRCDEVGAMLIFDEVQMGFGRTGKLFGFENYNVIPDIVTFAKGLGGGMPIGAFVSKKEIMEDFCDNPILGHITTFGGHPVCSAAALANLEFLTQNRLWENAQMLGDVFESEIKKCPKVKYTWGLGLFRGVEVDEIIDIHQFILKAFDYGIFSDAFIFKDHAFRFAPPLIITKDEVVWAANQISKCLMEM